MASLRVISMATLRNFLEFNYRNLSIPNNNITIFTI